MLCEFAATSRGGNTQPSLTHSKSNLLRFDHSLLFPKLLLQHLKATLALHLLPPPASPDSPVLLVVICALGNITFDVCKIFGLFYPLPSHLEQSCSIEFMQPPLLHLILGNPPLSSPAADVIWVLRSPLVSFYAPFYPPPVQTV